MKHKTIKHIKTLDGWTDQTEIDVKISAQYTALTAYTEKKSTDCIVLPELYESQRRKCG